MKRIELATTPLADAIALACDTLRTGGLVVYPTETVYGVGADAASAEGVTNLLKFKNRPAGKAISILVENQEMAELYVELNADAQDLYSRFLPGPVTVISKSKGVVDARLASEGGTLGVRISSHAVASALVGAYGAAITTTSANPSGGARPYTVDGLLAQLSPTQLERVGLILDAGTLPQREPSTVIDTTQAVQSVVRGGAELLGAAELAESEVEMQALAAAYMRRYGHVVREKPLIFTLEGVMGAGKTHFAKGLATALGVTQVVTSPTYTFVKEYEGVWEGAQVRFVHIDCWRSSEVTAAEIGLSEYLQQGSMLAIEWPDPLLEDLRKLDVVVVRLQISGDATRTVQQVAL